MTSELATQLLLAALACAWIGDFIRGFTQRKKTKAETELTDANATQVIVGSATTLVEPLANRIKELNAEVVTLREELTRTRQLLRTANNRLEKSTAENERVTAENFRLRTQLGTA
jgi:cell shape-determining protein MreC